MGLKDLGLKAFYDSDSDDLLHDFYVPVLGEAVRYERLAGFFSSKVLASAARGIYRFILNGGEMKLITSAYLQQADIEAIRRGVTQPESVIAESGIREIQEISEPFIMEHLKALSWLIAKGRLSIKIAIPLDEFGVPKTAERIEKEGLFHSKVGLLKDRKGDSVSFNGSINETARAWMYNRENFHVFKSWVPGDSEHLKGDLDSLERWFDGRILRSRVIEIPETLKSEIIRFAPADIQELNLSAYEQVRVSLQDLRDYQKEAMDSWLFQQPTQIPRRRGILEMATGSGKTWVAIGCLQALDRNPNIGRLLTVIAVPYKHLIPQWRDELLKWKFNDVIELHGEVSGWEDAFANLSLGIRLGHKKRGLVVTTHDTLSNPKFADIARRNDFPMLLIVDEVHSVGSPVRRERITENYTFRLGLSATPTRYFDDEGTKFVVDYFGGIVYSLPIEKAISMGVLVPYEYFPRIVELSKDEFEEYVTLTKKYASVASAKDEQLCPL